MRTLACILLNCLAFAQEILDVRRAAAGDLAAGEIRRLTATFNTGDFAAVTITRQGPVTVEIFRPDGVLLRRFRSPAADGKREIPFVADQEGRYRIELSNPAATSSRFEFRLDSVTPLQERPISPETPNPYTSRVLDSLRSEIAAGTFWTAVARKGVPLVEPEGTDGKYQLVTFLWRGDPSTRNVVVLGPHWGSRHYVDNEMRRIPDTGIWHLTKRLPAGARFEYRLSPNDPLNSGAGASKIRRATA